MASTSFLLIATMLLCSTLLYSTSFLLVWLCHLIFAVYKMKSCSDVVPRSWQPQTYPFLGCFFSFYRNRHRLLDWYTELLAASPTQTIVVRRVGAARTIVTANPEHVEHILKSRFDNYPKGRPFTEILGDFLGSGIFNADGQLWCAQRKIASHDFSARSLRELLIATLEDEVGNRLLPILASACEDCRKVDLQELFRLLAFDVICRLSLGVDPGCLDPAGALPSPALAVAFDAASEISARRGTSPVPALWKAKRLLRLGSEGHLRDAINTIHSSVDEIIRKRRSGEQTRDSNREDLLSRLISSGQEDEVIRDMVISFIMAGRDTTSAAMTWLFWLLSQPRHKEIETELVQEVTRNNEKPNVYDNLKEMGYLKACLCESMRLYPPVAWDSKHAKEGDELPDGTRVEKGDRVTYFPYGMGRMERVWGEDCVEFRPGRWAAAEGPPSAYKFPVFQAGPRVCLGKEMAFTQMKYVVSEVVKRFEVRAVGVETPVFVPLLTAHMAGGLMITLHPRRFSLERL